ncbi:hypothetical protein ACRJ4W_03420 [Streptomyces sp. GLT-R25]
MPADRDRLARTYLDSSGYHGPGLMVNCPVFKEQLICPVAEDPELGGRFQQGEVLRRLVEENPGYALGVSRPHPLAATGEAYGEAVHALAVARNSPDRLAAYRGRPSLVHVLPRRAALAWARAYLEPLHDAPKPTVDVVRLAVTFTRSGVARLLHLSRTTVTAHCRRAERRPWASTWARYAPVPRSIWPCPSARSSPIPPTPSSRSHHRSASSCARLPPPRGRSPSSARSTTPRTAVCTGPWRPGSTPTPTPSGRPRGWV